jgi:hypothetical protein
MSCNIYFCGDLYVFIQFEDSCSHLLHSWYLVFTLRITLLIGKTSFAIHNKDQNDPYLKPHWKSIKKKGLSGWIAWGEQFFFGGKVRFALILCTTHKSLIAQFLVS